MENWGAWFRSKHLGQTKTTCLCFWLPLMGREVSTCLDPPPGFSPSGHSWLWALLLLILLLILALGTRVFLLASNWRWVGCGLCRGLGMWSSDGIIEVLSHHPLHPGKCRQINQKLFHSINGKSPGEPHLRVPSVH